MFVKTILLTDEQKKKVSEMDGKIILWILEGRSVGYMSDRLNLPPWQIQANIDEMLYILKKQVGIKRFIKALFRD